MRLLSALVLLAACSSEPAATQATASRGPLGTERADCRADKTCDPGLLCLSNVCVRPPPADCTQVAEILTSFDLGNYAEPEERAPIAAKYKARCEATYVSKEAGECIEKAADKQTAQDCAPTLFPVVSPAECGQIIAKVRGAMMKQIQSDPRMLDMMGKAMTVMQQSCEQDAWPESLGQCALAAGETTDALAACQAQMSPALQQKIESRMRTAMMTP